MSGSATVLQLTCVTGWEEMPEMPGELPCAPAGASDGSYPPASPLSRKHPGREEDQPRKPVGCELGPVIQLRRLSGFKHGFTGAPRGPDRASASLACPTPHPPPLQPAFLSADHSLVDCWGDRSMNPRKAGFTEGQHQH